MISRPSLTLRRTAAPLLAAILLGAVVAGGCQQSGPQLVSLKASEFAFTPSRVTLKVGQPVQLTVQNGGVVDHDLKTDLPLSNLTYQQADNSLDEQQENITNGVLDLDYGAGHTGQVTFVPTKAGTYTFSCDVAGHREAGMQGTFIVQ
jgi:uncharacterized cupredoxin-like copper-binding protein